MRLRKPLLCPLCPLWFPWSGVRHATWHDRARTALRPLRLCGFTRCAGRPSAAALRASARSPLHDGGHGPGAGAATGAVRGTVTGAGAATGAVTGTATGAVAATGAVTVTVTERGVRLRKPLLCPLWFPWSGVRHATRHDRARTALRPLRLCGSTRCVGRPSAAVLRTSTRSPLQLRKQPRASQPRTERNRSGGWMGSGGPMRSTWRGLPTRVRRSGVIAPSPGGRTHPCTETVTISG